MSFHRFDPFQVFEVDHLPCLILYVKVVKGRNITKGWVKDLLDVPDPYVKLQIRTSPNGIQRTTAKDNDVNPIWNETFKFYINLCAKNELELVLMDANYIRDEYLSSKTILLSELDLQHKKYEQTVNFNDTSEVDIEIWAANDNDPKLRYSLTLCDMEKEFLERRRKRVFEAMQRILGNCAPESLKEVPTIAVIGSGGGFRAMTALCGVFSALVDSEILDMVTYAAGLSGSAWYLSTLYSHPDWPQKTPKDLNSEIRNSISSSLFWLLNFQSMYRYISCIMEKRRHGQPVSFTDFFGHLVGETLLKGRLDTKLTDQREKLKDGSVPLPMYTCLHVKKHVSAMVFHEWMEFSPYEIGMPKYGTFMDPVLFGSKFFMGHLVKQHPEPPLHFLQGIWGSAFCIQFKRLLQDDKKVDTVELLRQEREELEQELVRELSMQENEDSDTSDTETESEDEKPSSRSSSLKSSGSSVSISDVAPINNKRRSSFWTSMLSSLFENSPLMSTIDGRAAMVHNFMRGLSMHTAYPFSPFTSFDEKTEKLGGRRQSKDKLDGVTESKPLGAKDKRERFRSGLEEKLKASSYFSQRLITNDKIEDEDEESEGEDQFDGIFEMYPTSMKKLYVVDGGLTFNSPFPLMLRPQRGVDLILSFDFSARPSDTTPPFKELLLAEKWARLNNVPFPPIDPTVVDREGLKECYVFKDSSDPRCPIVMHFPLVNITFRDEKLPGVPRETEEELEFAKFDIFDDPERPYSTFNFKYSNKAFDRLTQLTEFNTLLCQDLILENIKFCIEKNKKYHAYRLPIKLKDIKKLRLKDKNKENLLRDFVQSFDNGDEDVPIS